MSSKNYQLVETPGAAPIKAWVNGVPFDETSQKQLANAARLPFIHGWIAVMPDVHAGIGATVGSVIPTVGAIVPAAVGVDLGCGMMATRTSLVASDLPDNLANVRAAIEKAVPHGRTNHGGGGDRGAWGDVPERIAAAWQELALGWDAIVEKRTKLDRGAHPTKHLGTLGTGNHFIEVCLDGAGRVWFMLHSGSRGVGNRIGTDYIEIAKNDMRKWMINLPDEDLAYLPDGTEHFGEYVRAVSWAQKYAMKNRELMMEAVLNAVEKSGEVPPFTTGDTVVNCHHNYVAKERHFGKDVFVTRKGAVRAGAGDMGIIPGSMGAKSYIVRGLGNRESFESCSHGAGRAMSRNAAKRAFTLKDHEAATRGVECRKDADVLDETPGAYKPIEAVMEAQRDLVEVVYTLKQVVCVKG